MIRYGIFFLDTQEWYRSPEGRPWWFDVSDPAEAHGLQVMVYSFLHNDRTCEARLLPAEELQEGAA